VSVIKVGDRVRVRSGRLGGTVRAILPDAGLPVRVTWDDGSHHWYREADLVLFAPEPVADQYDTAGWTLQVRMISPDGQVWDAHRVIPTADMNAARQPRCMTRDQFREMVSQVMVSWGIDWRRRHGR
jgi:hypothetical protein